MTGEWCQLNEGQPTFSRLFFESAKENTFAPPPPPPPPPPPLTTPRPALRASRFRTAQPEAEAMRTIERLSRAGPESKTATADICREKGSREKERVFGSPDPRVYPSYAVRPFMACIGPSLYDGASAIYA